MSAADTYKKVASYADSPSSMIAEGQWSMHIWLCDSHDISTGLLTKHHGFYEHNPTIHTDLRFSELGEQCGLMTCDTL